MLLWGRQLPRNDQCQIRESSENRFLGSTDSRDWSRRTVRQGPGGPEPQAVQIEVDDGGGAEHEHGEQSAGSGRRHADLPLRVLDGGDGIAERNSRSQIEGQGDRRKLTGVVVYAILCGHAFNDADRCGGRMNLRQAESGGREEIAIFVMAALPATGNHQHLEIEQLSE